MTLPILFDGFRATVLKDIKRDKQQAVSQILELKWY